MTTNKDEFYKGKVPFVTGAGSGIGRAAALAFAGAGASVDCSRHFRTEQLVVGHALVIDGGQTIQ